MYSVGAFKRGIKKGKQIMENVIVNTGKYRVQMEAYGKLLGKAIHIVGVKNADPKYNEKRRNGAPVPEKPIRIFAINSFNINSVKADIDANGNMIIVFNGGEKGEARFPVTQPEFKDVEIATVREAVLAAEENRAPIFFKDLDKLTKEVVSLNVAERNRANDFAKEMAAQAGLLDDTVAIQNENNRRYYAELNQSTVEEMQLTVSTTIE